MSHICVDITRQLSANATLRGQVVVHLLRTGVPSITKICVAPESAIASLGVMVNTACRLNCIVRALMENTVWLVCHGRAIGDIRRDGSYVVIFDGDVADGCIHKSGFQCGGYN
jgi:hypothetical protein